MSDFSELYLTYYSALVQFAKRFVIQEEEAENVTQDVFTDIWERHDTLDDIENMKAYLYCLIKNRCLDFLRHKMFEDRYVEDMQMAYEHELNIRSFSGLIASNELELNETERLVMAAIDSLPCRCRDIFLLSRIKGLKYREISEQLGLSVNTVESQIGIALRKLRVKLKAYLVA